MGLEEQVIQKFPYRCPYCDQLVSYDRFDLRIGENRIECPTCHQTYIKVVSDLTDGYLSQNASLSRRKGRRGKGHR